MVTDIDEQAAAATARELGGDARYMHQDVRNAESHRLVARTAAERGPLTLWINNAGVLWTGMTWEMSEDDVRRHVEVNILGVIWGAQAAIAAMASGHIINIALLSSHVPAPGLAVYGATKQAVLGFSLSLEGELQQAGKPIRVSAICPDVIDTDMVRAVAENQASDLLFSNKHLLAPEDIAARVVELIDHPRLMVSYPRHRALLAHLARPFPSLGLRVLEQYRKLGRRHRVAR